tara:strand:- start:41 stop:301 length:261 start_codon:yes stop_codon:yes gene_type:complete
MVVQELLLVEQEQVYQLVLEQTVNLVDHFDIMQVVVRVEEENHLMGQVELVVVETLMLLEQITQVAVEVLEVLMDLLLQVLMEDQV